MTPVADSQIAAFLERLPYSDEMPTSADEPQVIFRGALELSREQEEALVSAALKWKEDLDGDLGRNESALDSKDITADASLDVEGMKHLQQRSLWDMVYHQKLAWRRLLWGGIYAQGQNVHVPFTRRVVQQMIARAQNYFFETDPWFAAVPVGLDDVDKAKAANEWAQYKAHEAKLKAQLEKSVELAFIRGECVVKTQHVERVDRYETFAQVAVDPVTEEPIMADDGDYIYDTDEFALEDGVGMVLKRDGETLMPYDQLSFVTMKVQRRKVIFSGPESKVLNYRDILIPLTAEDVQTADVVIEFYDLPAIEIVEEYIQRLETRGDWDEQEYPRVMELLRQASSASRTASAAAGKHRAELGESTATPMTGRGDPMVKIAAFHMWIDANNDGKRENVFMLLDLDTKRPILYDYVANVYDNAQRPYRVVRINPVDGRWHGLSMLDVFWQLQKFADLTANRWDLSLSQSGAVTFWHPEHTVEGRANPNLELNCGKTYRKTDPRMEAKAIVERVPLYEFKGAQLETLLQFTAQLVMNLSGVSNVNDAASAGLDTAKLATGVRNMDRSGQEQFAPLLSHLQPGVEGVCEDCLVLCVRHMDELETFHVLGDQGAFLIKQLAAEDVRKLKWNIALEMTRYKSEQENAEAMSATQVAIEYYGLPPLLQFRLASLYRQRLKTFGIRNVDAIIVVPSEAEIMGQAMAGPAGTAQPAEAPQNAAATTAPPAAPPMSLAA